MSERRSLALLSALAEAPDLDAAAAVLLNDLLATTGARRAFLLRFNADQEQLVVASHAGFGDLRPIELTIGERSHPWMVATLTLSPVLGDAGSTAATRLPFDS